MNPKTVPAPAPAKASEETNYGWACHAGTDCPTGGRSRRTFSERFFAIRAAKNHTASHGCKAHVVEVG